MRKILGLIALIASAHACSSCSTYVPQQRVTGALSERTVAAHSSPSKRGEQDAIRLASYGLTKLEQAGEPPQDAIHLRVAISGNGNEPVTLDTGAQRLQLPNGRQISPARVESQADIPPLIRVEPGSARTVDLYFALPPDHREESSLPQFGLAWTVVVGTEAVTHITPFDRLGIIPAVPGQELTQDILDDANVLVPNRGSTLVGPPFWGW